LSGRAWVFGDNVDTDLLAPGRYMRFPIEEIARHCLEGLDPRFAAEVRPGDFIVGGRNFGLGSSREQAAEALRCLGVAAVIAQSFAGIFYRNAINLGLPVVVCEESTRISVADLLSLDLASGTIRNETRNETLRFRPLPDKLVALISDGGLVPHLEKRFRMLNAEKLA
jgi:3-isopropylmalate/(R)-2-methylmalate dehydratase small subunit